MPERHSHYAGCSPVLLVEHLDGQPMQRAALLARIAVAAGPAERLADERANYLIPLNGHDPAKPVSPEARARSVDRYASMRRGLLLLFKRSASQEGEGRWLEWFETKLHTWTLGSHWLQVGERLGAEPDQIAGFYRRIADAQGIWFDVRRAEADNRRSPRSKKLAAGKGSGTRVRTGLFDHEDVLFPLFSSLEGLSLSERDAAQGVVDRPPVT